jgi:hypothetical protein
LNDAVMTTKNYRIIHFNWPAKDWLTRNPCALDF